MNHKVKKIATKGNLGLYECTVCKSRILARDKYEMKEIYSKIECEQVK